MAQRKTQKDVLTRLAESGEDAIQRLTELPGGARLAEAANALREGVDELTKRVRSLDPLERRVAMLERRLDELSGSKPAPKRRSATATKTRKTAAAKPAPRTRSRKPPSS